MRRLKREFRLTLSAMFIGAFVLTVSANAELLSEFNFEKGSGGTTYNSVAGVNNGTLYGPDWVTGKIGSGALDFNGATDGDYVDPTTGGYPGGAGLATGTFSFWIATTAGDSKRHVFTTSISGGDTTSFAPFLMNADKAGAYQQGNMYFSLRTANNHSLRAGFTNANTSWLNGEWHLITATWDTAINGGSNAVQYYIDGNAQATSLGLNTIVAADTFSSPWAGLRIGGSLSSGSSAYTKGSLDDVSVWGDMLTGTEALALYNLGNDSVLNYGASDAQTLFDIFNSGSGSQGTTGDGLTWKYVTGLSGTAGTVLDHNTLVLGSGVGVQIIPEPGTLALLATGLIGLLAYAWRKRK